MKSGESIKDILQLIKDNRLDAKEGLKRISELKRQAAQPAEGLSVEAVEQKVTEVLCRTIKIQPGDVNEEISFKEMGVDSISSVEIVRDLNGIFQINMDGVQLYDYPTLPELSRYIFQEIGKLGSALPGPGLQQEPDSKSQSKRLNHRYEYMNDLIDQFSKAKPQKREAGQERREQASARGPETVQERIDQAVSREPGADQVRGEAPQGKPGSGRSQPALQSAVTSADRKPAVVSLKPLASEGKEAGGPQVKERQPAVQAGERQPIRLRTPGEAAPSPVQPTGKIMLKPAAGADYAAPKPAAAPELPRTLSRETAAAGLAPVLRAHPVAAAVPRGIAIIGMSGRFPGANTPRELWRNLRDGVCSTVEVPKSRFDMDGLYDENRKAFQKTYCRVAGLIDRVDEFDPLFFNISPREAEIMDPQQRIFLEEAWKALEDAGYSDQAVQDTRCGVFVGCAPSDYVKHLEANRLANTAEAFTGTSSSILAARISYFLNLKGPSISIDTACSSSLVAVHQACASIWDGECEMALAGGIRLMLTPDSIVQSSQMEILSAEGACRPFDQDADGTLLSEGVGVLVLKPLDQALKSRDHIYGVIRGTGVNQDGRTNGITAPSVNSQTRLEKEVYRKFGIDPAEINYVEAHGTGTVLGDPIEVKALTEAFREFTKDSGYCALGSIKANIGHATMAAGVAGIIKILMGLKSRKIPPLIHFRRLNERIRLEGSPFYINTELTDWPENRKRSRMAAISGFGFSGTNCHIVIQEFQGEGAYPS